MSHSTGLAIFFWDISHPNTKLTFFFLEQGACQTGGDLTDGARQRLAAFRLTLDEWYLVQEKKNHIFHDKF